MTPKKLKLIFALLFVALIVLIGIRVLSNLKNQSIKRSIISTAIEGTRWPVEDVPLLAKEGLIVEDIGSYNCQASISSGVTYSDIKNYLIELYNKGFKPFEEYGSLNPNRLLDVSNADNINDLSWMAEKDNYVVNVLWAREGATDDLGFEYDFNFDMNLFINPGITNSSSLSEESSEEIAIDFGSGESGE